MGRIIKVRTGLKLQEPKDFNLIWDKDTGQELGQGLVENS